MLEQWITYIHGLPESVTLGIAAVILIVFYGIIVLVMKWED